MGAEGHLEVVLTTFSPWPKVSVGAGESWVSACELGGLGHSPVSPFGGLLA